MGEGGCSLVAGGEAFGVSHLPLRQHQKMRKLLKTQQTLRELAFRKKSLQKSTIFSKQLYEKILFF
ncbi:hypothetical protein D9X91_00585 [Falsibacillus albus]|uniref:Uncharacterized protein n=1 Tax=Falsibacillus albus TaxID=2478915 RepID=A0A3L7KB75_9BACI|nr:hypothetical protein D9X91_00585 [Falsibacillus albus]